MNKMLCLIHIVEDLLIIVYKMFHVLNFLKIKFYN